MKYPAVLAAGTILVAAVAGCNRTQPASGKTEPATVANHVTEDSLNTVTLTEKAEQRLGIELVEVQLLDVRRTHAVGSEVVVPPGQMIIVSAPVTGKLSLPAGAQLPSPGTALTEGQSLFTLTPLLSPERDVLTPAERVGVAQTRTDMAKAKLEAERLVESARLDVQAAQIAVDRAVQLLQSRAGSQRTVDETATRLKLAQETLKTAEIRHEFLQSVQLDEQAGELAERTITSPASGVLQDIQAAVGETVTAGETLFAVVQTDPVWIRIPIYVGRLREVDTTRPVAVAEYGNPAVAATWQGKYVSAPPSANPTATTVDLYYELANADGKLRPGQRLSATLPLQGTRLSLIVPFDAVLYDIYGGTWVYQQVGEHVYARGRVEVEFTDAGNAVLARGPQPGAIVVTKGAVELFGTEFGVGH